MTPPLSIVIPSYSRADLLELCLRSVLQFAPAGTEVIVVDDASTGGVISRTAATFPGVFVHRLPRRSGFCLAANAGIALATAPVVEMLNDDTEVTASWADAALRWFANPGVVAVAPLVLQNDPTRRARGLPSLIDSAGDDYDVGGFARKRLHGQVRPTSLRESPVWGVSASAGFYRRESLNLVGAFPSDFGAYFEDVDLSFRLRRLGEIRFDPSSIVWHRVSASYGRRPRRALIAQQSCNEERVYWRNTVGRARYHHLPRHAAVLVGKALRRLEEGTFTSWMTGRIQAWINGS